MASGSEGATGPVAAYLAEHAARCNKRPVGAKTANRFLKKIRVEATGEQMLGRKEAKYHYDLTDVSPDVFDWRAWISGRLHGNSVVVGPGISKVFLAFFNEYDHNCKQA